MTVNLICMNSQRDTFEAAVAVAQARRQQQLGTASGWVQQQQQQRQEQTKVRGQELSIFSSGGASSSKRLMTPTNTDTPLRRSEVGLYRDGARNVTTTAINDDEEERRQARRHTLLKNANITESFEDNETLKKCLEIYNGNKLSRDNAWSMSLIDTLSLLLDRHHKSLNNFKVAGSSLEASSKVYGLRVDSVHTDVLRMSAGLNAQKFTDRQLQDDDDDDVATGGEGGADPNASAAGVKEAGEKIAPKPKAKRVRKAVSTITKNKETLNARLDTVPLQDPVFGKLNSIVGSINSSTRLMNNILLTTDSELRLRTTFRYWDAQALEACDYTLTPPPPSLPPTVSEEEGANDGAEWAACERLLQLQRLDELQLRPLHTGYVISDTPEAIADDKDAMNSRRNSLVSSFDGDFGGGGGGGEGDLGAEMSMAFDINAECEPVPALNEQPPMLNVDYADFEEMTTEERTAINNCRGLRKAPVLIEDLRPVDASSKLEYSYRPLDKISQFWAGPSHWKFKRTRPRPSSMMALQGANNATHGVMNHRAARRANQLIKKRSKQLQFEQEFDEVFIKLEKYKARKANFQKKWDQRKLKLPTDLQLDSNMFYKFKCAPCAVVEMQREEEAMPEDTTHAAGDDGHHTADEHFGDHDVGAGGDGADGAIGGGDGIGCGVDGSLGGENMMNMSTFSPGDGDAMATSHLGDGGDNVDNTVLEIATSFDGAPSQVTKIIVPFAKRAKVIDMKNLKRCCTQLINKQIKMPVAESMIPKHPIVRDEHYTPGMASFKEIYNHLPEILTQSMVEALSPSVAFYSVLHLANDYNLRLIPQEDLEDFKIRQLMDD